MIRPRIASVLLALSVAAGSLATAVPAWADPPGHARKERQERSGKDHHRGGGSLSIDFHFSDSDRIAVRDYYGHPPGGRCPPGLARKNNGCLPPGQAKKWRMGYPLPRDVIFYDLPRELSIRLSVPPSGYRYVRVAGDILMIAIGSGMVAAAIKDLAMM